ncbi:MAG TPA: hypothetical protein VKS79_20380 [Gemmataceae bacterium]|nr:hypothetical protein [Gemmataceae bacterium]
MTRIIKAWPPVEWICNNWAPANGGIMTLTAEQERAIQEGHAVVVTVGGQPCVVVRKDIYDRAEKMDYGPWTDDEMNLLAAETADLLAGDEYDEQDDS